MTIFKVRKEDGTIVNVPVGADTTYSNDTPIVEPVGSIKEGQTFENVSIQDMLTLILYPYIDIKVSDASASPATGTYDITALPILKSVTVYVKKNSATNLSFKVVDKNGTQFGEILTEKDIVDGKLTFTGTYNIQLTNTFTIMYSYNGEGGVEQSDSISVGTFTIKFTDPQITNLTSALGDSTSYSMYSGQTADVDFINATVNKGSTSATGGITYVLTRNTVKVAENTTGQFTLSGTDGSTTQNTTYTVTANYTYKEGTTGATSSKSVTKSFSINFIRRAATVDLTGIYDESFSMLTGRSISGLGANFYEYSDKITSVKLKVNGAEQNGTISNGWESKEEYNDSLGKATFSYSDTVYSSTMLQAIVNTNQGVISDSTVTLTGKAPYCYGFVDESVTLNNITRQTLEGLQQTLNDINEIQISQPGKNMKVLFAAPGGTYTKVFDADTGFNMTNSFDETNETITFADDTTTQVYQIFLLIDAVNAPAHVRFE